MDDDRFLIYQKPVTKAVSNGTAFFIDITIAVE